MRDRIRTIEVIPAEVPFSTSFSISRGTVGAEKSTGPVVFVRIETESGAVGWGEQRALPYWSYETVESISSTIEHYLAPILIGADPFAINAIHQAISRAITPAVSNGMPFARTAVDIALHDLAGKLAGVPVHALLGGKVHDTVELCWAIGVAEPSEMALSAEEWKSGRCFKVKVAGDPETDLQRIHAILDVAPDMPIWLDANQSYSPSNARRLLDSIRDIANMRSFEQPTPSIDWLGMADIRRVSHLPISIDEGCFGSTDLARAIRLQVADQVVLKLCKSGGIRNTQETATVARANGMELLGSGLTDCGISFAASIHLFSTLDLTLPAELNGPQFLEDMLVSGLEIDGAVVRVPDSPGLGVEVNEDRIRSFDRAV